MNIQIYFVKRNFDVQRAERFFKERRIPFQLVDMKKNPPGKKELQLFARQAGGMKALLDPGSVQNRSHPALYTPDEERIAEYIRQQPELMRTPAVRNGTKVTFGNGEETWRAWVLQEQK